ncbi:hypothetical protein MKX34_11640 [Paenibacillus sp. FSL R5-0636]
MACLANFEFIAVELIFHDQFRMMLITELAERTTTSGTFLEFSHNVTLS